MEAMGYERRATKPSKASAAQDRSATTTSNVLTSTQVQNLRRALSTRPLDPSALYTAYLASKPHLTYLTRSEFSNLIAAFGALSDYPNAERLPRADGFVVTEWLREALAGVTFGQKWWDVVLEVGANQSVLGRRTADVDRYWLMLAHLGRYRSQGQDQVYHGDRTDGDMHNLSSDMGSFPERVHHSDRVGTHNQESDSMKNRHAARDRLPTGSTQHLAHARIHYTALARNHLDESVHYAYLRALLDVYPALAEARIHLADALSQLLTNTRFRFEPRLARLFWSVIHTVEFIPPERQALLDALALRASTHKHVPRTQGLNHRLDSGSDEDPVLALRHAILDFSTSDEPWVRREAELIVLHHQQSEGWSSLVALAGGTPPRALAHPPRRINVLLGLRQGEEHQQLEVLWDVWMAILGAEIRQDETRSGLGEIGTVKIDRAILLRFLRAAAIRRSDRVVSGVERLLLVMSCVVFERDGIEKAEAVEDPRGSGRAQMRATLAVLARLLRPHQSPRGHNNSSTARVDARLSFAPDAVTLNVLCRALARCTSGLASPRLRALFDQLAQAGICGPPGYHFGTNEADGRDRFIVALAEMVRGSDARVSFVRHTRPLLKTFLRGFQVRRDEEAARVVGDLLEAEDNAWRSGQRT
ncbi:hypothetical protein FRC07_001020 [Ceratobasidium sp. 392]|nr:hypothetical protein FRC07_001020 [Ceratobasidium sp. 392]